MVVTGARSVVCVCGVECDGALKRTSPGGVRIDVRRCTIGELFILGYECLVALSKYCPPS